MRGRQRPEPPNPPPDPPPRPEPSEAARMASEAMHAGQMIDGLDKRDILRELIGIRKELAEIKALLQAQHPRRAGWEHRVG